MPAKQFSKIAVNIYIYMIHCTSVGIHLPILVLETYVNFIFTTLALRNK